MRTYRCALVVSLCSLLVAPAAVLALAQDGSAPPPSAPAAAPGADGQRPPKDYDSPWPQSATRDGVAYTVDRPTFVSLDGAQVKMTAPLQVTMSDGSMMSGSIDVSATLAPSDVSGDVEINRMVVVGATLDGADDTSKVQAALNALLEKAAMTVSRSVVASQLDIEPVTTPGLRHDPPVVKVVEKPTVLLAIQGPPHSLPLAQTGWRYVTNTPFIVLLDPQSVWHLRLGQGDWRAARSINGPWQPAQAPPDQVVAALGPPPQLPPDVQRDQQAADQTRTATKAASPPDVLVATEPTVLISINGQPQLAPLCDGVQSVTNTDSVLLRTASPDAWWTLASGRWFSAQRVQGPWNYAAPASLPASFANLPATGQYASARASVPGTTEAKEAVLANSEMRTVTIDRSKATCDVKYQGQPQTAPIDGTSLYYVRNASQPVVKDGQTYYCCEAAAWFSASAVDGPWTLCDKVPEAIYRIPPSCPIFACTFVEVVGSDASTVSFGFTPGYVGSYLQDGTAVYGTGYDYPPADLGGGATQPYPQTYGSDPGYDADSGTFAPPTGNTYIDEYPAVQPYYMDTGYGGWGWCPGWSVGWGCGWGNWGYWNHWNNWWNHWHPYANQWNHDWNQYQHNWNQQNANRQALADRGRNGLNDWASRATRTPGGQVPTRTPGGEIPTRTPGGEVPTRTPGGEVPTRTPGGEVPTNNPGGEIPTRNPGGEIPTRNPGGEIPTRNPGGEIPTRNPGGEMPTRYPGGQVPTRYPSSRQYGGNYGSYGNYSGFHPAYHSQAGAYGGGYRAPQYGNAYRGGGQVRGMSGGSRGGGGAHGGGGRR
jgi:hypothetical protein